VIQTKVQSKENQNAEGRNFGNISVDVHGLVDPVAVTGIPENSAEIG
jgi:hypothetical protein